jgi:polysaccharide deacetylase family protein (PEP-CTERM system associated)
MSFSNSSDPHRESSRSRVAYDGALTVDLEDWRCALNPDKKADYRRRPRPNEEYLRKSTNMLLEELEKAGAKATFFVLGEVAQVVPDVVREVASRGHEIASHSPVHLPPQMVPRTVYEEMIADDIELLAGITGKRPIGFRTPYMSIGKKDGWLIELLAKHGFLYDSSVAPTWTPYWGIPSAPKHPYYPLVSDISKETGQGRLMEIPLTVWPTFGRLPGFPIAGGFYMRAWPTGLLRWMFRRNIKTGHPLNLYVHPGNLESDKERVAGRTLRDEISQYAGSRRGLVSFRMILSEFRFGTLRDVHRQRLNSLD